MNADRLTHKGFTALQVKQDDEGDGHGGGQKPRGGGQRWLWLLLAALVSFGVGVIPGYYIGKS